MFEVQHDDSKLSRDDLKSLGVQDSISSVHDFLKKVSIGYESALGTLRAIRPGHADPVGAEIGRDNPGADLIANVHEKVFGGVLKVTGKDAFRTSHDSTYGLRPIGHPKLEAKSVSEALDTAQASVKPLLSMVSGMDRARMISRFQGIFMGAEPFKDVPSLFVNRTISMVMLESHLEHAFDSHLINRRLDAQQWNIALRECLRAKNPYSLDRLVTELGGPKARVYFLDAQREIHRGREHEKEKEKEKGKDKDR